MQPGPEREPQRWSARRFWNSCRGGDRRPARSATEVIRHENAPRSPVAGWVVRRKEQATRFSGYRCRWARAAGFAWMAVLLCGIGLRAGVVYETTSPYHHIQVIDQGGTRILSFNGSMETRMSLQNPLRGHFEYTEFFHFAWLWNTNLSRVLMIGLGGGSAQRSFLHHYPAIHVDSVEIDPVVVRVATNFFHVRASERHRIQIDDGRVFMLRSRQKYDLIVLDAYVRHRYGSQIPHHLTTREFFELAREHLTEDGVLAYNVITTLSGSVDMPTALTRTLQAVFPQVYCFRASESQNVVLLATRARTRMTLAEYQQRLAALQARSLQPPRGLLERARLFRTEPPAAVARARVLADDFAPVEGLERGRR